MKKIKDCYRKVKYGEMWGIYDVGIWLDNVYIDDKYNSLVISNLDEKVRFLKDGSALGKENKNRNIVIARRIK